MTRTAAAAPPSIPPDSACEHQRGEESALVRGLFTVHNMMMRVGDRLAARIGLTSARWLLLCELGHCESPPTLRELSGRAMLSAQNVSRMIAAMEGEGLVDRFSFPGRGRAVFVRLTDKGRLALDATRELAAEFERWFLRGLSGPEVDRLAAGHARLIGNLEEFERHLGAAGGRRGAARAGGAGREAES